MIAKITITAELERGGGNVKVRNDNDVIHRRKLNSYTSKPNFCFLHILSLFLLSEDGHPRNLNPKIPYSD